eukprot:TRINITY_DN1274_c0_g1_i2.p1 TRINITY_DN1274_c0_g1~~TRINITY_DN1274_c0_g1_i2.p1  ORF type:complete len:373 (-),score=74.92 TRINITY_DN1274_c0_g1_i2:15-1079(-)
MGDQPTQDLVLALDRHVRFFNYHLKVLPSQYASLDTSRMTVLYFCLSALDVLGAVDTSLTEEKKKSIIEWIYAQQLIPDPNDPSSIARCGFRGGPYLGNTFDPAGQPALHSYDEAHITMTYTAICILKILGDDLSRINRPAVIGALGYLQEPNGSFRSVYSPGENDMRFVFCAFAISSMLNDWSGFDLQRSVDFVANSQSYDGGIGLAPELEGHGGSTYCAVACLALANQLDKLRDRELLIRWLLYRQGSGYTGRPHKPPDSCYSFWLGASLKLLGVDEWADIPRNRAFNLTCQPHTGGFSKVPGVYADVLHSYMGLCGLSIMGQDGLAPLNVARGITEKTSRSPIADAVEQKE